MTEAHDSSNASQLDELVFGYLERLEDEPERASQALDELCASHPQWADELRVRIELLVGAGLWKPADGAAESMPERLGDFRLLRRLGLGGMGVVFLAEQESVGRRVALKLIKSEQLFYHGARARFLREAQAIARLDHPSIVQVLTVGEEAGVPYLAMELVRGAPLDRLIERWRERDPQTIRGAEVRAALAELIEPDSLDSAEWNADLFATSWIEIALCVVRDVALALQHAHQRGVLHRDVKPSNILLAPDGRVRLLDFGLASLSSAPTITQSGAQMGSLAYMAPEQIDGRRAEVGPATDVYGLGVTLHELLALQLPYQGASVEALRRQVLDARATSIRSRNPAVSGDIETLCLKAMDRDVGRRYPSAAAFARDIDNVLERRPIEARPPSVVHRAVRWTQRHPARATALGLGVLLLVAGPLGWELNRVRTARQLRESYERSERDFHTTLGAIGHVLRDTAVEELEDVPRMQHARLVQIDRALELFSDLQRERPDDLLVLSEGGELYKSRGDVLGDLGRRQEGLADYGRAIEFHRRVVALDPSPQRWTYLSAALSSAGKAKSALSEPSEALALFGEALELVRRASASAPQRLDWRTRVARVLLGITEARRIRSGDEGTAELDEALATMSDVCAVAPNDADAAWTLGRAHDEYAAIEDERGRQEAALERAHAALDAYGRAHELEPGSRFYAFDVASGHHSLAKYTLDVRRIQDAEEHARAGLAEVEELVRDFPESRRYRALKLDLLELLGRCFGLQEDPGAAREFFRRGIDERERLLALDPERCEVAVQCAIATFNLVVTYTVEHLEPEEALRRLDRVDELLSICESSAEVPSYVSELRESARYQRALALCIANRDDEARVAIEGQCSSVREEGFPLRMSADLWSEYGACLERVRSSDGEALAAAREQTLVYLVRAVNAGYRDAGELGSNPALDPFRDDPRFIALLERLAPRR